MEYLALDSGLLTGGLPGLPEFPDPLSLLVEEYPGTFCKLSVPQCPLVMDHLQQLSLQVYDPGFPVFGVFWGQG